MPKYSKYNPDTGEILALIDASERSAELNGPCIEGHYDPKEYIVVDGSAQKKPDAEIEDQQVKQAWIDLRRMRDSELSACDWTQVPDAPVDRAAWATYRQALRDLPSNTQDPRNPVWPTPPA